jgi:hypothetical protein
MMRPYLWRVALSPAAWIIPLSALAFGASSGFHWGRAGALVGLLVGTIVGIAGALLAYHVVVARGSERRERELAERLERELTRPKPSRRGAPLGAVDPITLATGSVPPPTPIRIGVDVTAAATELVRRAATDPDGARREAEALAADNPRDGRIAGLYARVLHVTGRTGEAARVGSDAMQMCVLSGRSSEAVEVLASLWDIRDRLTFEAGTAVELARRLEANGEAAQARWCVDKAAAAGAESDDLARTRERLSQP